jgi:hypothetical protein
MVASDKAVPEATDALKRTPRALRWAISRLTIGILLVVPVEPNMQHSEHGSSLVPNKCRNGREWQM